MIKGTTRRQEAMTAHALGRRRADRPRARRPAGPLAGSVIDDDRRRRQTPASKILLDN